MSKYGGSSTCPRCTKAVYMAEQIIGPAGQTYHKACLTCKECNRRLDSTSLTERDKEIYCKSCYGKMFGPSGYGYGGGAGVLSTESSVPGTTNPAGARVSPGQSPKASPAASPSGSRENIAAPRNPVQTGAKPRYGGSEICPSCNKAVYVAEQVVGPQGVKYHKSCFKCSECNKMLDSTSLADRGGVIFCTTCHAKQFGIKGYGFAGGAAGLTTD